MQLWNKYFMDHHNYSAEQYLTFFNWNKLTKLGRCGSSVLNSSDGLIFVNIARGTTDPGYWVQNLNDL